MTEDTFPGYARADGSVGIRNHVLVLSITGLTGPSARRIGAAVRGTHTIVMPYNTGLIGRDRDVHLRTLRGLALNGNVAAILVISDHVPKARTMAAEIAAAGRPVETLTLDDVDQDAIAFVAEGTRRAARLVRAASAFPRHAIPLCALRVGLKCGRSDPSSGLMANPAVGAWVDRHLDAGGTAVFGEVVEWLGAEHLLAARAADATTARALEHLPAGREAAAVAVGLDLLGNNPSPTNIRAGLSTIEEKSLGGISKTGTHPIAGVLDYAEAPVGQGLYAMDTANYAPEHMTALAAAGCQLMLFTTGAGNSFVSGLCPTLKVCANETAAPRLREQIDVALDDLLSDSGTPDAGAARIDGQVRATAGGQLTWGEILGEGEDVVSRFGAAL